MNNNHLEIHFSEELKKIDFKDLSGLYYSLKEMKRVEEVTIYIENELIEKIPSINLEEEIKDRNNIDQVVLYYIDNIDNKNYVPVTKYKDSSEEKIDYIITSLKENIPNNLISFVNNHLKLISYEMDNNTMVLNFNESLLEDQDNKELILEEIAYSIMDNFDVTTVLFYVNGTYQEMITNKA